MITVLMGATHLDARRWCLEQRVSRQEIGRTVFPSSSDPAQLRGRRDRVQIIYGAGALGSHTNFAEWLEVATVLNSTFIPEKETPDA